MNLSSLKLGMNSSFELLEALKRAGYDATERDPFWWPHSGAYEVIIGAILTQQAKWEKVENSLNNLQQANLLSLETLANTPIEVIAHYIKPSGFYNTKAKNIQKLSVNILNEFGDFSSFKESVSREWLLAQKGVGEETADGILCYGCLKEAMVVDSYTHRLLSHYGFSFESYGEIQEWLIEGIDDKKIEKLYGRSLTRTEVYARFHGKIVMFCKEKMRGKVVKEGIPGI